MSEKKVYTEAELLQHAKSLLANGHRHADIFKFLRARTDDAEMRSRIMTAIQKDQVALKARSEHIEKVEKEVNSGSTVNVLMGMFCLVFALVIYLVGGLESLWGIATTGILITGGAVALNRARN